MLSKVIHRVSMHLDSQTVAMEVGIRLEVCILVKR